ncbi:MAG: glycosyltransferase family 2 protein [Gemmatimonadaceae bacterium]|nr:glycosyltransferase family 2 protein [Gemmatimonadaceae bacterium]
MIRYAVVIPARNARAYVGDAVASARTQTVPPDEVIVVDDGSTDDTAAVARAAGARVVPHPTARGVSAARNTGIDAVAAPVVAFLDADDLWTPDHAMRCLAPFANGRPCVAFGRSVSFMTDEEVVWPRIAAGTLADPLGTLLVDNTVPQSSAVVSRDALLAVGGYDEALALSEDYDLWCRLADRCVFVHTGATTTRRRVHAAQTTWARAHEMREAAWQVRRRAMARLAPGERPARLPALVAAMRLERAAAIRLGDAQGAAGLRALAARMDGELETGDLLQRTVLGAGATALALRVAVGRLLRMVR